MNNMKNFLTLFLFMGLTSVYSQVPYSTFKSFDQIEIAYSDRGEGSPVILFHGFISSGKSWESAALTKELLSQGYRVIIPDLRGNGNSEKSHVISSYDNDAEVKDIDALVKELKITSYMAIGYSRGAIVLAKLLSQDSRITKAVLGGMGIDFTNPDWNRRIMFQKAFSGEEPLNETTRGAVNYAKSIGADLEILSYLQKYQPVTSIDELHSINAQTLVIAGDQDKDNGDPKDLSEAIKNAELVIIPGDHNNTYKTQEFANKVLDFLKD